MFRFSLRELLLITVIVALAVGWWVERRQSAEFKTEIEDLKKKLAAPQTRSKIRPSEPGWDRPVLILRP